MKLAKATIDISLLISSNKLKKEGCLEFKKGLVTNALLNYKFHINTILTKPMIKTERSFSFIENLQENSIKENIEMHSALLKPKKKKSESKSSHSSKEIINLFTDQEEIELINKVLNLQKSIDEKNNQIFEYIEKIDQLEKANNVKIQILIKKNKDLFEKNKNIEDILEKTRENEKKLLIKINDLENTNQNLRLNLKNKEFDYKNVIFKIKFYFIIS